ncbi:MAG: hypothetical protein V4614_19000 [Pseudomonadota bacterium]
MNKSCPLPAKDATPATFFASRSVTEHLLRGIAGVGALFWAVSLLAIHPFASIGLALLALVAFRGCPMCWLMGLIETVHRRLTRGDRRQD